MIARYKKKSLLSRCECGYFQLLWLLLYTLVFFLIYLLSLQSQLNFYTFLNDKWGIISRNFLWSAAIPNNLRLIVQYQVTDPLMLEF